MTNHSALDAKLETILEELFGKRTTEYPDDVAWVDKDRKEYRMEEIDTPYLENIVKFLDIGGGWPSFVTEERSKRLRDELERRSTEEVPKPLTEERLKEIRERAGKSAIGEWVYDASVNEVRCGEYLIARDTDYVEDAEFIAHARQDIPDLLNEIERLSDALHDIAAMSYEESTVGVAYAALGIGEDD